MDQEPDDVVAEIRRERDEHARAFGFDLDRIVEDLQRLELDEGGEVVTRSPRKPETVPRS